MPCLELVVPRPPYRRQRDHGLPQRRAFVGRARTCPASAGAANAQAARHRIGFCRRCPDRSRQRGLSVFVQGSGSCMCIQSRRTVLRLTCSICALSAGRSIGTIWLRVANIELAFNTMEGGGEMLNCPARAMTPRLTLPSLLMPLPFDRRRTTWVWSMHTQRCYA